MPINILMPALSPTMEKGNLAKWLKKEGDAVKSGDVIAEIETDKATMEVEAVDDGTLAKIVVPEGTQDVAVNDIIAVLAGEGEDVKAAGAGASAAKPAAAAAAASPSPQPAPQRAEGAGSAPQPAPAPRAAPVAAAPAPKAAPADQRLRRSAHLLLAAGATAGEGRRHRYRPHQRFGPAWPRRRARCRGCEIRQGPEGAIGRSSTRTGRWAERTAGPRDVCGGQLRGRAARQHAQDHRAASDASRSRRSRIST